MGVFHRNFPLPMHPGLYVRAQDKVEKILITGNNALLSKQMMKQMQRSRSQAGLLCLDTYGLEPDQAALRNLFAASRIGDACRESQRTQSADCLLVFRPELGSSDQEAIEKETYQTIQVLTSVADLDTEDPPPDQPSARDFTLTVPLSPQPVPLALLQRLRLGLAQSLLIVLLAGLFVVASQLWHLWPVLPLSLGLGIVLPVVYEILPFPWGVLRGLAWGGIFALLWYALAQFVLLLPAGDVWLWALVVLVAATWIGRGIYRPWRSLRWENVVALGVCILLVLAGFLWGSA